jgi:RimJ/RimL family protein N-acetyltransferase
VRIIVTQRLILSLLQPEDAPFILELVNEPDWLKYIGDRGVRSLADARGYIERGPQDMYTRLGFGLYRVELKSDGAPIGLCGLIKRDSLPEVDIGFAFLKRYRGHGYAKEAAEATLAYARTTLGLTRILAITSPDNADSIKLLGRLGFNFVESLKLKGEERETRLYSA